MDHELPKNEEERPVTRGKWVLIGFLLIAAFFLWTEHRAHLLGVLPYLLILACPLMHLFMHGGHGHHGHHHRSQDGTPGATGHSGRQAGEKP